MIGARWVRLLERRASLVWFIALAFAVLGGVAVLKLPSGIYPEMEFPRVVVVARIGNEPPEIVEAKLTRPLEEAVAVVQNVRYVRARTIRGAAELSIQLVDGTDPILAEQLIRAAVEGVDMPAGVALEVERVLPTAVPVVTFNVTGARGVDERDVRDLADRVIRPALVRVGGVGGVDVQGGRVREIEIILDPAKLAAHRLTPSALADKLAGQDVLTGVGRVIDQYQTLPVLVDAQPRDAAAIAALPIAQGANGPVLLGDVARVVDGAADPDLITAGPHGHVIVINVARLPGTSTPVVVAGARAAVGALRTTGALPAGVRVDTVYDQAALVDESMASVRDAILIGVALALVVIAVFLRDPRAGLVAAVPVPLSLLATFAAMALTGVNLNLMSLGGLAIAIGLVVDDAIVVTEAVVRRVEDGLTPRAAAREGLGDLFAAVIGTTLTTVVVFAPLALLSGITGSFLGALAGTLSAAVLLSLLYAVTVAPLLAAVLLKPRKAVHRQARFTHAVGGLVRWVVGHRIVAVIAAVALLGAGVVGLRALKTGFLPPMDEGAFVLDFAMPPGTSLEDTDKIAQRIDKILAANDAVQIFARRTGAEMGPATATVQNEGDIMVRLKPPGQRGAIEDVMDEVRDEVEAQVPEARVEFVQVLSDVLADLAGNPDPIDVVLTGDDPHALEEFATKAGEQLEKLPMLEDFFNGVEGDVPVLRLEVDRRLAGTLGIDADDIAADLDVAVRGRVVAEIQQPSRTLDVRVRFEDDVRYDATVLAMQPMAWGTATVKIGDVTHESRPPSPSVRRREGLRPAVIMSAAVSGGDLGAAEDAIRSTLAKIGVPKGIQVEVGGQAASAAAAQKELITTALIGAVLVLLVLVVQLRSMRLSLVILFGAPLAVVGAFGVLWATGIALDVSSLAGCILLVGLVVKNGILLLEHAQHELARGAELADAMVGAVERRLRPVLMTTLATLAGLAPLALGIGAGASLQRPLAVAVIGGLVLSTAVTIVVMPGLAALVLRRGAPPTEVP